jgi:LysR family transcriptional regulator, cys regulon transcriptional activator
LTRASRSHRFVTTARPICQCEHRYTAARHMKLQQLRYLAAVVQSDLNITAAAVKLRATQSAISKQLRLLEDELGFDVFARSGRTLTRVTPPGERVIRHALKMLRETDNIQGLAEDLREEGRGALSIGTTHTQARYILPPIIQQFRLRYPKVQFHLHQGTSEQIAEMAEVDRIDFAMATGSHELFGKYVLLPCYQWNRRIIVPVGHPLTQVSRPSLRDLAAFPIVTYVFSFSGRSSLHQAFVDAGLTANVALTARDADVIKTYVRLGLGVGIVADVALDPNQDRGLVSIDAAHLFPVHTTWIGFARDRLLRGYMYELITLVAPHLDRRTVDRAANCRLQSEADALFADVRLPRRPAPSDQYGAAKPSAGALSSPS